MVGRVLAKDEVGVRFSLSAQRSEYKTPISLGNRGFMYIRLRTRLYKFSKWLKIRIF